MLDVDRLTKRFGGLDALKDVSLHLSEGQILGLIGPNGAGKSTLFAVISGFCRPDSGSVAFRGKVITGLQPFQICKLGIVRTFQLVKPFAELSVLDNVVIASFNRCWSPNRARRTAHEVLRLVGMSDRTYSPASSLTIADRKRLELARALATGPAVLLLDEVMAGLNQVEIHELSALLRQIRAEGKTLFVVEHVMAAVMSLSDRLAVLDHGQLIAEGPPTQVCQDKKVIEAYLGESYEIARSK